MRRRWTLLLFAGLLVVVALVLAACDGSSDEGGDENGGSTAAGETLKEVQDRGTLKCGVNGQVPGWSFTGAGGELEGFDVEYCKAVAAAVLGDPDAVELTELTAEQRFTALQSGEIDVLIRNTTWTSSRDGTEGAAFATTTFYDGQGMMVAADSDYQTLEDMEGTSICVLSGTTTELNLETSFQAAGISYEPLSFEDNDLLQEAFVAGRCDGWTSDKSQLAGIRGNWAESEGGPDALRVLDVTMSKEPLGPVTRDGDSQWFDVVNWVTIGTIQAEEFGITQDNVEEMKGSDDPAIQRFLGQATEGEPFDAGLGLDPEYMVDVISAVGNYEEMYNRTIGPDTPLGLERGPNKLWTEGGLLYPPPNR